MGRKPLEIKRLDDSVEQIAFDMAIDCKTLKEIGLKLGFQTPTQFSRYRVAFPEFDAELTKMREYACEYLEDRLLTVADEFNDARRADIMSRNILSIMAFRNPKKYSPKQQIDVNVSVDIVKALESAERRIIDVGQKKIAS